MIRSGDAACSVVLSFTLHISEMEEMRIVSNVTIFIISCSGYSNSSSRRKDIYFPSDVILNLFLLTLNLL